MNEKHLHEAYSDLLRSQDDPALLHLVQDLDAFYAHEMPPASLTQMEAVRFEALAQELSSQENPTQESQVHQYVRPLPGQRASRWRFGLNVMAAILVIALLIVALTNIFILARTHAPSPGSRLPQKTVAVPDETLTQIYMINATTGWALGTSTAKGPSTQQILHTTDGGATWLIVHQWPLVPERPGFPLVPISTSDAFFLSDAAWVEFDNQLYLTTDAGSTWTISRPFTEKQGFFRSPTFIDKYHGWLLGESSDATGRITHIQTYRTSDSGLHWTKVAQDLPIRNITGISFKDAGTGWLTGSSGKPHPMLYITHDGGHTWQQQDIAWPAGKLDYTAMDLYPPHFFSKLDGIMASTVEAPATEAGVAIYETHDGGHTWLANTVFPLDYSAAANDCFNGGCTTAYYQIPQPSFTTMTTGWLGGGTALFTTHDSGRSWQHITFNLPQQMRSWGGGFVNAATGWVLADQRTAPSRLLPAGDAHLFKTEDGGRTWKEVPVHVFR